MLAQIYFCSEGSTLSSASVQTFIKKLKEVLLEFCELPFFVLIIDLNLLFFKFFYSPGHIIILGSPFGKYDLSTVTVILWKSDNPLSIKQFGVFETALPISGNEIYTL